MISSRPPSLAEMILADGQLAVPLTARALACLGSPSRPFSPTVVESKFHRCNPSKLASNGCESRSRQVQCPKLSREIFSDFLGGIDLLLASHVLGDDISTFRIRIE